MHGDAIVRIAPLLKSGLSRREGKMFRKQDTTYPWSEYQRCDEKGVHFRSGGATVVIDRHDVPTTAFDILAQQLR